MLERTPTPRWPWYGALAGLLLGASDYLWLRLSGVQMRLEAYDVTLAVMLFFGLSFAGLGYAMGKLMLARARASEDAALIREQYEALQASQARLVQAEKLAGLGRMAAGVAHEVRNPLGVIRSSASLIREGLGDGGDADLAEASEFIVAEVDRLDGFVRSVLNFSRPLAPELAAVDASAVVDRALALASGQLGEARVDVELGGTTAPPVRADPDLLVQLLMGLLVNAGEAGGQRVTVRAGAAGGAAWFEVADDGPGVAQGDEARLFEPFFTTKAAGTGLGLAMASRIAQAHGGRLELTHGRGLGPDGGGACLRVTLPGGVQ